TSPASPPYTNDATSLNHSPRRTTASPLSPYTTLFRSSAGNIAIQTNRQSPRRSRLPRNRRLTAERPNTLNPRQCEISGLERPVRSEEHTSELQSREKLVCRLLLVKKKLSTYGLDSIDH